MAAEVSGFFQVRARCGHFNGDSAKDQHKKTLDDSGVKPLKNPTSCAEILLALDAYAH
jgi:hypothetical protein